MVNLNRPVGSSAVRKDSNSIGCTLAGVSMGQVGVARPTFGSTAVDPTGRFLYAVARLSDFEDGIIQAHIDRWSGTVSARCREAGRVSHIRLLLEMPWATAVWQPGKRSVENYSSQSQAVRLRSLPPVAYSPSGGGADAAGLLSHPDCCRAPPYIRFHDLRHTLASLLIQQGESRAYARDQMGHGSIQITGVLRGT